MSVHPTAIIDANAVLGIGVEIGPYCTVGPYVRMGDNNTLKAHVVLEGNTVIGSGNTFYQFSSIGAHPQDLKFCGEKSELVIGNNNIIRENVTIHCGTNLGGNITRIGNSNNIMTSSHIGHDCIVGNNTIIGHLSALAGHTQLKDWAILSAYVGVRQFVCIGEHAFVCAYNPVFKDIPAYVIADGNPMSVKGINKEGFRRRGFSEDEIRLIFKAYNIACKSKLSIEEVVAALQKIDHPLIQPLLDSYTRDSSFGLIC